MKKISKVSLTMLVLTLGIFVAAGTANADCVDASGHHYVCGDVVTTSCTFDADMHCATSHGLIVGVQGITIDGAGFELDGTPTSIGNRNCAVKVAVEGDACGVSGTRMWCVNHPCRTSADGNVIDSGIVNANTVAGPGNSCSPNAPMAQGGCDDVTVKNLEIRGWCDGIFMSGDCECKAVDRGSCYEHPAGGMDEYRLSGILIEGNYIHDNGNGACGTYTPCLDVDGDGNTVTSDGGDWENHYYNDAIFTAQFGLDSNNCGVWSGRGGLPSPDRDINNNALIWIDFWKIACDSPSDSCTCSGTAEWCPWCDCFFQWYELINDIVVAEKPCKPNRIIANVITNQKGCSCISCTGACGINLQGGLEADFGEETIVNSGGNDVGQNVIKHCDMSGIMHTHASKHNRIHHNYLLGNLFGGITNPCGWNHDNYLFGNVADYNYAMGIGINSEHTIANNYCLRSKALKATDQKRKLGYCDGGLNVGAPPDYDGPACNGIGIFISADAAGSEVVGNNSTGNAAKDIVDAGPFGAVGAENMCCTKMGFGPGCQYQSCWNPTAFGCSGDCNNDGKVNTMDWRAFKKVYSGESGNTCP